MLEGCGEIRALNHCQWEHKLQEALGKAVWHFSKKLNMYLPYDPFNFQAFTQEKGKHMSTPRLVWMVTEALL